LETNQGVQDGRLTALEDDTTHSTSITQNAADIDALELSQAQQENRITSVESTANTALGRTEGISYLAAIDHTYISNRVYIMSPIDTVNGSAPQLSLLDNSTLSGNVLLSILCGAGIGSWSDLVRENDGLFLLRKNDASQSYVGGMTFCTHGGSGGFRGSYDPAVPSVFRSDISLEAKQLKTTGNIQAGTLTLAGNDVQTTLDGFQTNITSMLNNPIGKRQDGLFFDSIYRGRGGGATSTFLISSPILSTVANYGNNDLHAEILLPGDSYTTGPNSFLRIRSAGTYRMNISWSFIKQYLDSSNFTTGPKPPWW